MLLFYIAVETLSYAIGQLKEVKYKIRKEYNCMQLIQSYTIKSIKTKTAKN